MDEYIAIDPSTGEVLYEGNNLLYGADLAQIGSLLFMKTVDADSSARVCGCGHHAETRLYDCLCGNPDHAAFCRINRYPN